MTQTFETRSRFACPAERMFEMITDPDFQLRKARDAGFDKVEVDREDEADGTIVITIDIWEPAHFGGGESHRTMVLRLDPSTRGGPWKQIVHGQEKRVRAEGSTRVRERGEGECELISEGFIELDIPMVGKMVEKKIKAGIEAGQRREAEFTRAELRRLGIAS